MSSALDMKFTGDAAQIERTFEKMKKMQQELLTLSQRIGQESRSQANQDKSNYDMVAAAQEGVIGGLGKMAAGYLTVNQLVNVLSKSYEHMMQKQQEASKQAIETNELVIKAAGSTGDLLNADKIKQFAEDAARNKLSDQNTALAVYDKISRAVPEADFERKRDLSNKVLPQLPTLSKEETPAYAEFVGNLAGYYGKDKTADQIVALANQIRATVGDKLENLNSDKLQLALNKLSASGAFSKDEAVAEIVSRTLADLPAGTAGDLADKLTEKQQTKMPSASSPLSMDDRRRNRFYKVNDPRQRLEMLRNDPELAKAVLGDAATGMQFSREQQDRVKSNITTGQQDAVKFNRDTLQDAMQQKVVADRAARIGIEAGQGEATAKGADRATVIKNATEFYNQQVEKSDMNFFMKWFYTKSQSETDLESRANNRDLSAIARSAFPSFLVDEGESRGRDNPKLKEYYEYLDKQNTAIQAGLPPTNWSSATGLEQITQAANVLLEAAKLMMQNEQNKPKAEPPQPKPVNVNVRGDVEVR